MLPPGADPNGVQASYENGGELRCIFPVLWDAASALVRQNSGQTPFLTQLLLHAVLIVKIPKTEEYKALQPKKIEVQ